jgi:hypothetical protein
MTASVALSLLGLVIHNVREFGLGALLVPELGVLPMIVLAAVIFIVWWRVPGGQTPGAILLVGFGLLNLLGGAIISVLPLSILPFEPEQTLVHYVSHILYGVSQLPLIWMGIRQIQVNRR